MHPAYDRRSRAVAILCAALTVLLTGGCSDSAESGPSAESVDAHGTHSEHGEDDEEGHGGEGVRLSKDQIAAADIELAPVGPGLVDSGVELLGEVRPNGERIAHIVPRFAGIVQETRKNVGDSVERGDVLAVIESSESLVRYDLKTLIAGVVLEKHLTLGEAVGSTEPAFVVADLSTIWIDLSVYPQDLATIRVGQEVQISAGAQGPEARGTISYVTPSMDTRTRTATARVQLPNAELAWRPGLFVSARVLSPNAAEIAIPKSAVQMLEGKPHVFVESDTGVSARAVTLGQEGGSLVQVRSGLSSGEVIVIRNAFLLKAELGKGEAEHVH